MMSDDTAADALINKHEVAAMLGVSKRTVDQWRFYSRQGSPKYRALPEPVDASVGKPLRFRAADWVAWAAATGRCVNESTQQETS